MPSLDISAYAPDFNENPYPYYAKLREAGPVHRITFPGGGQAWLVVGHEEARQALTHPALSKDWRQATGYFDGLVPSPANDHMLDSDPPRHTRLRKLVARGFTARRVEALRPLVQRTTDDLLEQLAGRADRRADLIQALAFPLPMTVICELLGVPDLDRDPFRRWSNEIVAPTTPENTSRALAEASAYLTELIEDKRCSPGDDLMSALIRTRDAGDRLSPDELIGMAFLLLVAGHETTVNLISNGVRALLDHPAQLAGLRADWGLLDGAVEEMLRYDGPVESATTRFTTEETVLAGVRMHAGQAVIVSLAGADRDPERFPAPDTFDIRRAPQGHLAFGHGIHFCLGAPLARMEGRIAIRSLLERFPELARDPDAGPPVWLPGTLIRGVTSLPVRW
ncbi:cytochrome P450 [Streptomyces sp. NPDC048603]|uniref:cytochrome P450 family protein n=1 Tax=Streptomyces sp. NPDC048603 TaxID=3365577 RepID=UPI0037107205